MATRLLRAEVWGAGNLARAASLLVNDPRLTNPVLAAYSRLVLVGADGTRLHEELFPAGGWLRGRSFARLGVTELAGILDAALGPDAQPRQSSDKVQKQLADTWPHVAGGLDGAIIARAKEREASLQRALAKRQTEDETRTTRLLDAFEQSLRTALAQQDTYLQLSFDDLETDQRAQLEQDRSAWRERLDALPDEKATELAGISRRYESVRVLWFPAAIVHLVPVRSAR
jgi:hypothetical protein